jgi:hypothetical protein
MTQERLSEYRSIVGIQLQFAQIGDSHKVIDMQEVLERWIAERLQEDIISALQEMQAHPVKDIICNMTLEEVRDYRIIQGNGMRFFCPDGFEARSGFEEWEKYQVEKAESFVSELLNRRLLDAIHPFIAIRIN